MLSWIAVVFSIVLACLWCMDLLLRGKKQKNGCPLPPGPKWGIPLVGHLHMLGHRPYRNLHKMAQKYGPIMHIRLGVVPTIVVSSPEAAELFLKTHDLVFASRPKMEAVRNQSYWEKDFAFNQYGPHWRNMRKLCMSELVSVVKIESMKSMRKGYIEDFVWGLRDVAEACTIVDLTEKLGDLIENMSYTMIFGRKYDMLHFRPIANQVLSLLGTFNIADYVPFVAPLDLQGIRRSMKTVNKVVDEILENVIDEHVQNDKKVQEDANNNYQHEKNFIDIMLSLTEPNSEQYIDRDCMKAIILDLIIASVDTLTITIDWILCELLRHPNIMEQLQSELESVVGLDRMVEESDLVKLHYLDLVLKESMRLHPVAPLLIPHESREDITINGYFIPKQSIILVNTWAIGHDQNAWSTNVEEFYPERFSGTKVEYLGNDFRFLPFGSGRRGCPGVQLGVIVVQLIVAQLIHCFNWELPDGISPNEIDMNEKPGLATPRVNPLLCIPTFRLHNI